MSGPKAFFSKILLGAAAWAARLLPASLKSRLYRSPALAGRIRAALNRAAPAGLTEIAVAAGPLAGLRMSLDLQAEKDYWLGTYEPQTAAALHALVQPGMTVYDVGANIGYISLQAALRTAPGGRVFAFEALPANVERLRHNLALNDFSARVTVIPAAALDVPGPARFLVAASGGMGKALGSAGRGSVDYLQEIEVAGVSLDAFVYDQGNPPPQVVKMDIEGGETLAVPGMRRLLAEARPTLLLELHGERSAQVTWQALTEAGYRVCRLEAGFPPVDSLHALDWKAYLAAFPCEWAAGDEPPAQVRR